MRTHIPRQSTTSLFTRLRATLLGFTLVSALAFATAFAQADNNRDSDLMASFNFMLEVDGVSVGLFTSVSGIGSENDVIEFRDGSDPVLRKTAGQARYLDVTLSRGLTTDTYLWVWRQQVEEGDITGARRDYSIILFDDTQTAVARWNFVNGWPSKLTFPTADGTSGVLEEVTLVHELMRRDF